MVTTIVQAYRSSFSGLSRETWLLSWVILINRCGYMAVPFMSIYITQQLHRPIADAGWVITLFGVGSVVGTQVGGYLTDKIGFRLIQIVAPICSGLLFLLFSNVVDFQLVCVLIVVFGFFVEAFRPANSAAIAAYSSAENLTRSVSLNRLALNVGWGVGSSLGGFLAAINYHLLFWVEGAIYLLVGVLILLLLPAKSRTVPDKPEEKPLHTASPWKDTFFVQFIVLSWLFTVCYIMLFRIVPVFWKEEAHLSESQIGMLLGLNGLVIALVEMVLIKHLEHRKRLSLYLVVGTLLTALGYLSLLLTGLYASLLALVAVLLITIGEMFTMPFLGTFPVSRASEQNRGRYSAAYSLTWAFANIVAPIGGAYVVQLSSYAVLWLVLAITCVLSAVAFRWLFASHSE
ncbi:MAG: MFS transporter [Spirosomataceae bacterium]